MSRCWLAVKAATALPKSRALPPPTLTTQSTAKAAARWAAATAASTVGSPSINTTWRSKSKSLATPPWPVTSKGFLACKLFHAEAMACAAIPRPMTMRGPWKEKAPAGAVLRPLSLTTDDSTATGPTGTVPG
eukprot:scaffold1058_cov155-Ochromonas_danica.AAC.12